jgi:dihydrofolate reductase
MGALHYSVLASLDGFVADEQGNFGWAAPDDEVHKYLNCHERQFGAYLYGRRMYEVMRYWQTAPTDESVPFTQRDYANVWRSADKVVFSSTLVDVETDRTRLERTFDAAQVLELKRASARDISIGGPTIAGEALRAGLVDYVHLFVVPHLIGAGLRAFSPGQHRELDLLEHERYAGGTVRLMYGVRNEG